MQGFLLKLHKKALHTLARTPHPAICLQGNNRFGVFDSSPLSFWVNRTVAPFESMIILTSPVSVYLKLAEVKPGIPPGHPNLLPANTGNQDQ